MDLHGQRPGIRGPQSEYIYVAGLVYRQVCLDSMTHQPQVLRRIAVVRFKAIRKKLRYVDFEVVIGICRAFAAVDADIIPLAARDRH